MNRSLIVVALLSAVNLSVEQAHAADARAARVVIHHNAGFADREDDRNHVTERRKIINGATFRIRSDEALDVIVDDPNPLLYSYSWKRGILQDTQNFQEAKKFAEAVNPVIGLLNGLTGLTPVAAADVLRQQAGREGANQKEPDICVGATSPEVRILCKHGINDGFLRDFAAKFQQAAAFAKMIPGRIRESAGSKEAAEIAKEKVLEDEAVKVSGDFSDRVNAMKAAQAELASSNDSSWLVRDRPVLVASLVSPFAFLAQGPGPTRPPIVGSGQLPPPGAAPKEPTASKPSDCKPINPCRAKSIGSITPAQRLAARSKQEAETEKLRAEISAALLKERADRETAFVARFRKVAEGRSEAEAVVKANQAFVEQVRKINVPILLDTVSYNATQVLSTTLTIAVVQINATAAAPGVVTGDFAWNFEPRTPVDLHVEAAAVYSFIEAKHYGTAMKDGVIHVVRTDNGDSVNGTNVGAMLTVVPRAWTDPAFGGGLNLGITPVKDKLGLFIGASFRLFNLVSIGGGLAYQQTQRLDRSQNEGDVLAAAGDLKTHTVFKSGPYITLSLKLK